MTTPTDDVVHLELFQRPEGNVTMRPLGLRPYILLEVKDVSDDDLTVSIEVGGGVPADPLTDLSEFLSAIADQLGGCTVEAPEPSEE